MEENELKVHKQVQSRIIHFRTDPKTCDKITKLANDNGATISFITKQLVLKGLRYADELKLKVDL